MKFTSFLALCLIVLSSCDNQKDLAEPEFQVNAEAVTAKVGEEVRFLFSGEPGTISFYSGEVGNSYEFKDVERIDEVEKLNLVFEVHNTPTHAVQYQVLVSSNFNGIYDYENIKAADWKDLSSRFHWAAPANWQTNWESSGVADIADMVDPDKPFHIAFRYVAPAVPTGTIPGRNWRTRAHQLNIVTKYGANTSLANYAGMSWKQAKSVDLPSSSTVTTSIMLFAAPTNYREEYEEWGVSKAFSAGKINLGTEFGAAVKGYGDPTAKEYKHIYSNPGTYKATFVASNTNIYGGKEVVKQIDITILP